LNTGKITLEENREYDKNLEWLTNKAAIEANEELIKGNKRKIEKLKSFIKVVNNIEECK
jgi:hypothetical protein